MSISYLEEREEGPTGRGREKEIGSYAEERERRGQEEGRVGPGKSDRERWGDRVERGVGCKSPEVKGCGWREAGGSRKVRMYDGDR
jgi:hypothetical protein